MFYLLLVLTWYGTWALDPEAVPEHPVTTIPVESEGVLNVFYDRMGVVNVQPNNSTTNIVNSITNGTTLPDPDGRASASTGVTTTANPNQNGPTETTSTVGFPTTSEDFKYTTMSTTTSSISSSTTTTTNKPNITSSTTSGNTTTTKNPDLSSPSIKVRMPVSTTSNISGQETNVTYNSGSTTGVYEHTNVSSSLGNISPDAAAPDNTTKIYIKNHTSDFYLPASALGNQSPENSSGVSNHTTISSDVIFVSNSSMPDKTNSLRDWNSTSTSNFTRTSQNSEPVLNSSNIAKSNISSINNPANIKEENGTIIMSSIYSYTNIPIVNNPINITDVFNPVNISDVFSPINISNIYSPINISGIYSPINIVNVFSPVRISNVRSPIRISNVYSPITIYDVYSPINITNVHSSVNASNVYSLISIDDYSRKVNISEKFNPINSSRPQNSNNNTGIYSHQNITNAYDIDRVLDKLNISDILEIFGLDFSDLYGPTNTSLQGNFTNLDSDDLMYSDHPDLYSTTEPYSYSTTDWADVYYTGFNTTNSPNSTNPSNVTVPSGTEDTSQNISISLPTQVFITTGTGNFTNTTKSASNGFDIGSFFYIDYSDNDTNSSEENDPQIHITGITTEASTSTYYTTEASTSMYYTTENVTTNSTKEPVKVTVNVTEPYNPFNLTAEGDLVNSSIGLNPDNKTIDIGINITDTKDSTNNTEKEGGHTCSGGDILKHIFLTYRLSPPETRTSRVYVIPVPVPVEVPVPVQVYNPTYYVPLDHHSSSSWGNTFYDFFPYYYGNSQPQGIYSGSIGYDPTSSYQPSYASAPHLITYMGHSDPLGYQGGHLDPLGYQEGHLDPLGYQEGHLDPYKYRYYTLNSLFDSSIYTSGDLDKRYSPLGPAEDTSFEPDPYFLMDISEGAHQPSFTAQIPQEPISNPIDYGNKDSLAYPSSYKPQGFPASYASYSTNNHNSAHAGFISPEESVSFNTHFEPQGSKSYSGLDSFYKGFQSEDFKLFSDYVVPQDTKSYFDYSIGQDRALYKASTHRGQKWNFLEMNAPKERTLDWTGYVKNRQNRPSRHSNAYKAKFESPMMSKFNLRPPGIGAQ